MARIILLVGCMSLLTVLPPADRTKPKIFNMERLNTAANEDDPCPSLDGQQFLYTSDKGGKSELYLASRKAVGEALLPERLLDELSGEGDVRSAFLLPKNRDGWEYLFFATQYHTGEKKNLDLYRVGRFNSKRPFQGYNAAAPIQLTCTEADEAYPWVSGDGKEIYFSRKTKEGWKLHRTVGNEPLAFDKTEELAVPAGFYHACLNKAVTVMIVQGPSKTAPERQDLYFFKRRNAKEPWGEPRPLTSINSEEGKVGTCSPAVSFDGKYLYFASDRPGGKGALDLYVVAVNEIEELK